MLFALQGKIASSDYMAFGVPSSPNAGSMTDSDAVVTGMAGSSGFAVDYYLFGTV